MKQFEENSEFEISTEDITEKINVYKGQTLCITIHLKRRPLFYIFTILLPVLLLYSLNPFVFLLPSQGGEKISMAVSVLLSFQLFLSIIRDTLPENSLTVSLFSIYVSLANFTSVIIVVVNILLLKLKDKWVLRMCRKNSASSQVDVVSGNVEEDDHTMPTWANIETQLNKTCFLCFFVFSISITAVILGMLTR
ncbi:acetylcholine receptor subunit delta-like [Haliotis cracherodii]|uniref:acetylcholine receptor subunit delta-like n=1 Tax=Haliotis cracherodii TaxID=6455 RepID=UPI0039EAF164